MQQLALAGNLQEFSIEEVFCLLEWGQTGTLAIKREQEEIAVQLVDGAIAGAEHFGVPQLAFDEALILAGYFTKEKAQELASAGPPDRRHIRIVLVEQGIIPRHLLEGFHHLQIQNAVCHLFTWEEGTFGFRSERPDLTVDVTSRVSIEEAVVWGKQFRAEWESLSSRIGCIDHLVELTERSGGKDTLFLSTAAKQFLALIDGKSSIRMLSRRLFADDLQAIKAIDELSRAGIARTSNRQATVTIAVSPATASGVQSKEDLTSLLARSERILSAMDSNKSGDRIKSFLKGLQKCVNDLLDYHEDRRRSEKGSGPYVRSVDYLEARLRSALVDLQAHHAALGAVHVANRRIDVNDLIDTYDLILGDTRHAFYMEAIKGLSALMGKVFDWVIGDEIDSPAVAAEFQAKWLTFFHEIETDGAELAMVRG